jgi:hypothetical protein
MFSAGFGHPEIDRFLWGSKFKNVTNCWIMKKKDLAGRL